MPRERRERRELYFCEVPLTVSVIGPLYASSATTTGGIEAALRRNMPTETQISYREALGEEIKPLGELAEEIAASVPQEYPHVPSTVFRRDEEGKPYLHANFLKGHLRECGESLSRPLNFYALKDFITRTLFVKPDRLYLEGEIKVFTSYFAPDVRLSTGVTVRQATEKTEEFVVSPVLRWTLYLVGDPRWDRDLLYDLLSYGSVRGLGPGRARGESGYTFELGELQRIAPPRLG